MDMVQMTEWLLGHVNETLLIRKEEDGDTDQVMLKLQKVAYGTGGPDSDDYVNDDRIILHGDGTISVDGGTGAAGIPRESYEITLAGNIRGSVQNNELHIQTDRATYRVGAIRH